MENAANNCTLHTRLAVVLASRKPDITANAQISLPFSPPGALFFRRKSGVPIYDAAILPLSLSLSLFLHLSLHPLPI
jgi:hypothetical protein